MNGVVIAETVRRHVTHVAYLSYLVLVVIFGLGSSRFAHPASMWPTLVALLAIVTGCGPIGPEFSSGTLQLILVKPVKRWVYLLSRVTGVVIVVTIAALAGGGAELLGRLMWGGDRAFGVIGAAILNCVADSILTASLLVFLGSVTRAYINAAIYLGVEFGLMALMGMLGFARAARSGVGAFLEKYPAIELSLAQIDRNLFPEFPPRFDGSWLMMVLINATIALVLAIFAFRSREVPYGAD